MAISKTLTPTNVTIQIPDFTDRPDQRANSNCIDKEADAINALNTQIANLIKTTNAVSVTTNASGTVVLDTSALNPSTQVLLGVANGGGWIVSWCIYNGQYKLKFWDTSGATMQVNASQTLTVYFTYLTKP